MGGLRWSVLAGLAFLSACGGTATPGGVAGACVTPGEQRCDGDDVQTCGVDAFWAVEERCATHCELGACVAPACMPAATRCDGPEVQQCNGRGTGWEFRQACSTACIDGACATAICSPWSRRCNGMTVEECDERGLEWHAVDLCALACEGNACVTTLPCTPGTHRCNSRTVEICTGRVWEFEQICEATTCIAGACAFCIPDSTRCSGFDVQRCTDAGAGWERIDTCTNTCVDGDCTVCVPGERRCSESTVEICAADGTGWVPASYCTTFCTGGACAPPECSPGASRCSADAVEVCDAGGSWVRTEICTLGCSAARCTVCAAGELRCSGDAIEACASDGTSWSFVRHCPTSCTSGACAPYLCAPGTTRCDGLTAQLCDPSGTVWSSVDVCSDGCTDGRCTYCDAGTLRCSGSAVEACASDESGWSFVQYCATGCTGGACDPLVCAPLSRRCAGRDVEICDPVGTSWLALETCTSSCRDGLCTGSVGGVCVPGTYRCNGGDVEACDSIGGGWFYLQTCLEGCAAGACGDAACMPFTVTASPGTARADGVGSIAVFSAPILDVGGTPVPDGTMVTVSTTAGTILAADADASTTALEVQSFRGKVDVALRAPAIAADARVDLAVRGAARCTGTATVGFVAGVAPLRSVGHDFTTSTVRDDAVTTAFWDLVMGRLTAGTTTFGFGEDGDLVVTGSYNINTSIRAGRTRPDAPQFRVAFIEPTSVTLDALPNGIVSGDDVLLINLQGSSASSGSAGNYEILTVLRTEGLRVFFVAPIRTTFGVGGNADLTGQKIMLQRIPRYRSVSVDGTLTASGWTGSTGGLLFFKASSAVSVNLGGTITVSGLGYLGGGQNGFQGDSYRGPGVLSTAANGGGGGGNASLGCTCAGGNQSAAGGYGATGAGSCPSGGGGAAYGDAALTKWHLGSGAGGINWSNCWGYYGTGGAGAGMIVILAPIITNAGTISADGATGTSPWGWTGSGGSGGMIYLLGNTVTIGSGLVHASAGPNAGAGRIRVDGTIVTGTSSPTFQAGAAPTPVVATARTAALDSAAGAVRSARLLTADSWLPGTSRLRYFLTNDGAATWNEVTVGVSFIFPLVGSDLRFRVDWEAVGPSGVPSLAGIALEYDAD